MPTPVTFEEAGTYRSDDAAKLLHEGRVLRLTFLPADEDLLDEIEIDLTYNGARDLALSIISIIGVTTESKSMYLLNGLLSALDDLQAEVDGSLEPSDN